MDLRSSEDAELALERAMMQQMWKRLRVWWRGWSDEDLESAAKKISAACRPGMVARLTDREFRAWNHDTILPKSYNSPNMWVTRN